LLKAHIRVSQVVFGQIAADTIHKSTVARATITQPPL
jgi:hypothetical protein